MDSFHCSATPCVSEKPAELPEPGICTACLYDAEVKLAELPHLAIALRSFLGGIPGVGMEGRVSGTSDPGTPLNLHVADTIAEIGRVLQLPEFQEIRRVWKKASDSAGLHEKWQPRGMPCPKCVSSEFGGFIGTERLSCKECGFTISTDKWHGLCVAVLEVGKNV